MGWESPENVLAETEGPPSSHPAQEWQALAAGRGRGCTLGLEAPPQSDTTQPLPFPGLPFPGEQEGPSQDSSSEFPALL